MGSINKRTATDGTTRYDVRFRDPIGRQRKRSFRRRKDADTFLATTEADKVRGTWIDTRKGEMLFSEWWNHFWGTTVDLRPSTRARDESYAKNHVLPVFGG